MVSVDARPGKSGRRGGQSSESSEPSSESSEPSNESSEPSSESSEPSNEEGGPRSGERRGRGPAPFGVSHDQNVEMYFCNNKHMVNVTVILDVH